MHKSTQKQNFQVLLNPTDVIVAWLTMTSLILPLTFEMGYNLSRLWMKSNSAQVVHSGHVPKNFSIPNLTFLTFQASP